MFKTLLQILLTIIVKILKTKEYEDKIVYFLLTNINPDMQELFCNVYKKYFTFETILKDVVKKKILLKFLKCASNGSKYFQRVLYNIQKLLTTHQ